MVQPFNWVCPFCNRAQVVSDGHLDICHHHLYVGIVKNGPFGYTSLAISCVNPDCHKLTLSIDVHKERTISSNWVKDPNQPSIVNRRLLPDGIGRPQPDYIPKVLRDDYAEACLIAELSPKASATLARRCIQGMIRDFCGITKSRLIDEIKALRAAVDDGTAPRSVSLESVAAIDHVREIGNIGAHMERNIDQIIEVDPGEARALIELIELLFAEWYVERNLRQQRLAKVALIGAEKKEQIATARNLG